MPSPLRRRRTAMPSPERMRTATTDLPGATGFQTGRKVANAGGYAIWFLTTRRWKAVGAGGQGIRTTAVASKTGRGTDGATGAGAQARSQGPHPTNVATAAGAETRARGGGMTAVEGRTSSVEAL
ncbi:hypothetical protein ZEAMMB73_Zm00001d013386 [Zea mays]|jgi:hypothetical protein|nr:hypothetical protein ZEAMMB73_Zm00001d013386 [Zea mays]